MRRTPSPASSPGDLGDLAHAYAEGGKYTVTLTVSEADGNPAPSDSAAFEGDVASAEPPNACTKIGTPGNDKLRGTNGRDVICGLGGNDIIKGLKGDDILRGGPGNDILRGEGGRDKLVVGAGNDAVKQ